jgi:dCMP deaminase
MLINTGIKEIYFAEEYPDELSQGMLSEAGVLWGRMAREDETK